MDDRFCRLLRWLRRAFPQVKCSVRRKLLNYPGYCVPKDDQSFAIVVNSQQSMPLQNDTLCHEFAHCLDGCVHDHGAEWGRQYARCYREWVKFCEIEDELV